jgi:hypothetical protein
VVVCMATGDASVLAEVVCPGNASESALVLRGGFLLRAELTDCQLLYYY